MKCYYWLAERRAVPFGEVSWSAGFERIDPNRRGSVGRAPLTPRVMWA